MTLRLALEAQRTLSGAGYWTLPETPELAEFDFEDEMIVGRLIVYDSASVLVERWEKDQSKFFQDHAARLRTTRRKAWNAYLVLIVDSPIEAELLGKCVAIEEDLQAARKIVFGVTGPTDLRRALAPLLQIQSAPGHGAEDVLGLVRDRLD